MLNTRYKILLTWVLLVAFVPAFGQTKIQSTCLDGTSIVDPDIIDFSYEIALAEMRGVNHHYHDSILVPQAFVDSIKSYVSAYHNATELSGSIMDYREFRYYNQEFGEILLTFDANSNCFYRQDGELIITNDTLTHYIDSLKLFAQSWSDTEISLSDTSSTINFYGDFNLFYDISGISKVDLILLCPDMLPCYKSRSGNFKDNTLKIILSDVNECDTNYYHHNWIYTVNSDCQIEINSQTSFSPIGAEWYYNCNANGNIMQSHLNRVVSEKDSIVEDNHCRVLSQYYDNSTMASEKYILKQDRGKIYYYCQNKFNLLFDFDTEIGDIVEFTFKYKKYDYDNYPAYKDTLLSARYEIESITKNAQNLKTVATKIIEEDKFSDNQINILPWNYSYTEIIGYYYEFMPTLDNLAHTAEDKFPMLRCYRDDNFSFVSEEWSATSLPCNFSVTPPKGGGNTVFPSHFNYKYSDHFSAACEGMDDLNSPQYLRIYIQNDSIIIEDVIYNQCCPEFALKVSEIINDSLYVSFLDTTTTMMCDCMCDFSVKINACKTNSRDININYNGNWYTVLPEDYMPLVEMGKRWNTLRLIPGPENTHPTHIEYSIESEQLHDFCWNGKKYYELKGKYIAHGDDVNPSDTATNYIREENGKVFLLDPNQLYTEDCKEALLYDFSAKIADTLTLGFDSIRYLVVPTETPTIQGRRIIALADLTEPELSNLAVWIEGVGDTRGLLMSKESLYIDGVINVLTCCHMDDNLIYQDSNYPDCGWPASLNKIISKHINIYPNPANNTIIIDGVSGKRLIYQIVNSAGLVVKEGKLVHTMELNLSDGVYLLLIKEKNKIVVAEKLIINHP